MPQFLPNLRGPQRHSAQNSNDHLDDVIEALKLDKSDRQLLESELDRDQILPELKTLFEWVKERNGINRVHRD